MKFYKFQPIEKRIPNKASAFPVWAKTWFNSGPSIRKTFLIEGIIIKIESSEIKTGE